jgi:predicted DNA-binding transcriptional regulator AlpA
MDDKNSTAQNPNQLLTPQQVADLLQVSTGTLENWRIKNHGPKFLKLGGQHRSPVRYRMQDVEDFMFEDAKGNGK